MVTGPASAGRPNRIRAWTRRWVGRAVETATFCPEHPPSGADAVPTTREKNDVTTRQGRCEGRLLPGMECPGLARGAIREGPADLWTSPSGRPTPSGAGGQAVDDARASPTALPTLAGLSPTSSTGPQQQQPLRFGFEEGVADAPDACPRIAGLTCRRASPRRLALRQGLRGDSFRTGTEEETNLSNTA